MKKVTKGHYGYIRYEKRKRLFQTVILFLLPLGLLIIGIVTTGTRMNLLTVVAVVGVLPACRSLVGLIMMFLQKSMPEKRYEQAKDAAKDLTAGYEMIFTAYEHTTNVEALVVCGYQVVCYTPDKKTDPAYLEKHIRQILSSNQYTDEQVKVMKDFKQYLQRVEMIAKDPEHYREGIIFEPDERYPDLSRDELVYHTLLAICL